MRPDEQTNDRPDDPGPDDSGPDGSGRTLDTPDPAQEFGKAAADDAELADHLIDEAGGDTERAQQAFDDASRGPVTTETASPRNSE